MADQIVSKLAEISTKMDVLQATQEKHSAILEDQGRTLLRNTITVETHERRSTLLEEEVKSIQKHVESVRSVGKALKWLGVFVAGVVGAVASVYEIISYMGK